MNGENESPLFTWLKAQKGGLGGAKIKWNFTKFLIGKDGKVAARYSPTTTPESIEKTIIKLLED